MVVDVEVDDADKVVVVLGSPAWLEEPAKAEAASVELVLLNPSG